MRRIGTVGLVVAAAAGVGCRPDESSSSGGGAGEGGSGPSAEAAAASDTALQRAATRILPEVEALSGLRATGAPRVAGRSRATLEGYLNRELERQLPPQEAERLTAAYARLGLVPDTLRLRPLLRTLLLEQIIGYYDPAADTLFVVDRVPADSVEPVLAHELVHALQDQYQDLDSLLRSLEDDNDRSAAARAAFEGHATFAMVEWQLRQMTGSAVDLAALPNLSELGQGLDLGALPGMAALAGAPRVIRESILFPYMGGLGFVQSLWRERPERPIPLGPDLPQSTEQILHPERALGATRDPPTRVAFAAPAPAGWSELYADGLGELETRIFLEEFLPDAEAAGAAAAGWDGDRYRLLRSVDREVLVWVSVWDTDRDAAEFSSAVVRAFGRRYGAEGAEEEATANESLFGPLGERWLLVDRLEVAGRPVVRVVDFDAKAETAAWRKAARVTLEEG